jgi:DNA-directed RNA polymerase specialized sigma24 family protein
VKKITSEIERRNKGLIEFDEGLSLLADLDPQAAKVVELKFFGGFTDEEVAHLQGASVGRIRRDWTFARAWLHEYLTKGDSNADS